MRGSRLFIENLNYSVTQERLRELFSRYGSVTRLNLIEGEGVGFVTMSSKAEAEKVIEALNGYKLEGRSLNVDEAHLQRDRAPRDKRRYRGRRFYYQGNNFTTKVTTGR